MTTQPTAPQPPAPHIDASTSGVCVLCRLSAAHNLEHACITQPGPIDAVLTALPQDEWPAILRALGEHPARPLNETGDRRGVDATWCVCQHKAAGSALPRTGEAL